MATFFQAENVGTLEQRALTPAGVDLLEYVAQRQRNLQHTFLQDALRRLKRRTNETENEILALTNAGFMEAHRFLDAHGPSNNVSLSQKRTYRLTDAGWRVVGGKPIWMENYDI